MKDRYFPYEIQCFKLGLHCTTVLAAIFWGVCFALSSVFIFQIFYLRLKWILAQEFYKYFVVSHI